jgi:hypothetical protein
MMTGRSPSTGRPRSPTCRRRPASLRSASRVLPPVSSEPPSAGRSTPSTSRSRPPARWSFWPPRTPPYTARTPPGTLAARTGSPTSVMRRSVRCGPALGSRTMCPVIGGGCGPASTGPTVADLPARVQRVFGLCWRSSATGPGTPRGRRASRGKVAASGHRPTAPRGVRLPAASWSCSRRTSYRSERRGLIGRYPYGLLRGASATVHRDAVVGATVGSHRLRRPRTRHHRNGPEALQLNELHGDPHRGAQSGGGVALRLN